MANWLFKIAATALCIAGLVGVGYAAYAVVGLTWASPRSGWPQVPRAELYVTTQPKLEDVAGKYRISQQNITKEGLNAFIGHECELNLRPDGTFSVSNYPNWSASSDSVPGAVQFVSTNGRWHMDDIYTSVYIGGQHKRAWSVVFTGGSKMDALDLRKNGAPYNLMLTYGDGDEGTVMTFVKRQ